MKNTYKISLICLTLALFLTLTSVLCTFSILKIGATESATNDETTSTEVPPPQITSISFEEELYTVNVNDTTITSLIIKPDDAVLEDGMITYYADDDTIISVDAHGNITGKAVGSTTLHAKISDTIFASVTVKVLNSEKPVNKFSVMDIDDTDEKIISGFTVGAKIDATITELKNAYATSDVQIKDTAGAEASSDALISTGMSVYIDGVQHLAVIVGDANGDGKITHEDTRTVVKYIAGTQAIPTTAYEYAVRLIKDNEITMESALLISRHIAKTSTIEQ